MSEESLMAELEKLKAENEALKKSSARGISLKVSQKGALSLYGMGRFPITLYKEQWLKILDMAEVLRAFITDNNVQLKDKEQSSQLGP